MEEEVWLAFHSFQVFLIWREILSPWGENGDSRCSQSLQKYCLCWEQPSEWGVEGGALGKERDTDTSEMHGGASHITREDCRLEASPHLSGTCEALGSIHPKETSPSHLSAEGLNYHIVLKGKKYARTAPSHRAFYNNGSTSICIVQKQ